MTADQCNAENLLVWAGLKLSEGPCRSIALRMIRRKPFWKELATAAAQGVAVGCQHVGCQCFVLISRFAADCAAASSAFGPVSDQLVGVAPRPTLAPTTVVA